MISMKIFETTAPHPEASLLTAFSKNALDRFAEKRTEECVADALKIDGTHIFAFSGSRLVLKHDEQVIDPLFSAYELAELQPDFDNAVLLGYRETGEPQNRCSGCRGRRPAGEPLQAC